MNSVFGQSEFRSILKNRVQRELRTWTKCCLLDMFNINCTFDVKLTITFIRKLYYDFDFLKMINLDQRKLKRIFPNFSLQAMEWCTHYHGIERVIESPVVNYLLEFGRQKIHEPVRRYFHRNSNSLPTKHKYEPIKSTNR